MIKFMDNEHEHFYRVFIQADRTKQYDLERHSLFYLLALSEETRKNINQLYDFEKNWILPEGLDAGWQCSGSLAITRLAFNLYNGYRDLDKKNNCDTIPSNIFYIDEYRPYMIEALKIRYDY